MICSHVLLQGHLCVTHPAAVGAGEGLRLLHREGLSPVVQVWREKGGVRALLTSPKPDSIVFGQKGAVKITTANRTLGRPGTVVKGTYS